MIRVRFRVTVRLLFLFLLCSTFYLYCTSFIISFMSYLYKLIKMLSVCLSVWMLTRLEQIVTAADRDL